MLKAKKKLTKREIRRDPLLETLEKGKEYVQENQQRILTVAGVLAVILVLGWGWNNSRQSAKEEAMLATTRVASAYMQGIDADILTELENVVAEYDSKAPAHEALYYLGVARMDSADFYGAREAFQELLSVESDKLLKAAGALKLAAIAEGEQDYALATEWYLKAANWSFGRNADRIRLQAAYSAYQNADYEQCRSLVAELESTEPVGSQREDLRYLTGLLEGK